MKTLIIATAIAVASFGTAFAENSPSDERILAEIVNGKSNSAIFSSSAPLAVPSFFKGERFESLIENPRGAGQLRQVHVRGIDGTLKLVSSTSVGAD